MYFVGLGRPELRGEILAAILSVRHGAAAAGTTVCWLRGLTRREPKPIELVALQGRTPPERDGVVIRRSGRIRDGDIHWIGSIPVTSMPLTLLDRAGRASFEQLEAECALALRNHLVSRTKLGQALADASIRTPGIAKLRRILVEDRHQVTRSENERILRRLIALAELGPAQFNVRAGRYELDVLWPELRLGIEVDAFFTHGDPESFDDDRWRDTGLSTEGIEIRRFTDRQLRAKEHAVVARLGAILALRRLALGA